MFLSLVKIKVVKYDTPMKIIYSNYLPVKGFRAINLFGIVFARQEHRELDHRVLRHESIHSRQMLELFVVGFYAWYLTEWMFRWILYGDRYTAYRNIGFEREAYANEGNRHYLEKRKRYAFTRYLRNGSHE